jgi:pimeloyl-ACP methyl ester carboxylesterase
VTRLRGRDVRRPWGRMRVWEGGSGTPLLAVHGLGGSGRYFQRLASLVGDRFAVVAPDLAGFGASDKPGGESYDRAFHHANLDAALESASSASARSRCCRRRTPRGTRRMGGCARADHPRVTAPPRG